MEETLRWAAGTVDMVLHLLVSESIGVALPVGSLVCVVVLIGGWVEIEVALGQRECILTLTFGLPYEFSLAVPQQ